MNKGFSGLSSNCGEFYAIFSSNAHQQREIKFLCAILARAIRDAKESKKQIRREAKWWFKSKSFDPFSYRWIIEILGIEHKHVVAILTMGKDFPFEITPELILRLIE